MTPNCPICLSYIDPDVKTATTTCDYCGAFVTFHTDGSILGLATPDEMDFFLQQIGSQNYLRVLGRSIVKMHAYKHGLL